MNNYFKLGFLKTASPELWEQSHQGADWTSPQEHRAKRQAVLESYEKGDDINKSKKRVIKQGPYTKSPATIRRVGRGW